MWFFVHKMSLNINIKFISYLVDGMQLMIFGELGIVGLEERPTYQTKKKKKRHNDIKYWSPKLLCNIQNCFGCHVIMYRYERSIKTMQVISTWHLLKNKDMGYSSQLQSFELNTRTKILWPLNLSATKDQTNNTTMILKKTKTKNIEYLESMFYEILFKTLLVYKFRITN